MLWISLSVYTTLLLACTGIETPTNFYGSPEIFSGYLPDGDRYVEAFSLHDDCFVVEGSSQQVFKALMSSHPEGMFYEMTSED